MQFKLCPSNVNAVRPHIFDKVCKLIRESQ